MPFLSIYFLKADSIETSNNAYYAASCRTIKINISEFQTIHEAVFQQILHLSKHASDPTIKTLVNDTSSFFNMHINIKTNLALGLDNAQGLSDQKKRLMDHLVILKNTCETLEVTYNKHFDDVQYKHPLWPLAQQYIQLINVLKDQIKLIRNHLDSHMLRVKIIDAADKRYDL